MILILYIYSLPSRKRVQIKNNPFWSVLYSTILLCFYCNKDTNFDTSFLHHLLSIVLSDEIDDTNLLCGLFWTEHTQSKRLLVSFCTRLFNSSYNQLPLWSSDTVLIYTYLKILHYVTIYFPLLKSGALCDCVFMTSFTCTSRLYNILSHPSPLRVTLMSSQPLSYLIDSSPFVNHGMVKNFNI